MALREPPFLPLVALTGHIAAMISSGVSSTYSNNVRARKNRAPLLP